MLNDVTKVQVLLTSDCMLQCKYCYVGDKKGTPEYLSLSDANDIMAFIYTALPEGIVVEFFGGEPLMAFDSFKKIVENYSTLNYSIPTNGLLLDDEKIEFISKHRDFIELTISLDGDLETQLENRGKCPDLNVIKKVIDVLNPVIRMVVVEPKKLYKDLKFIAKLGAKKISIGIPFLFKNATGYKFEFLEQLRHVKEDTSLSHIWISEDTLVCEEHCQAGSGFIAITPNGDIYPCNAFYFKDKFKIGNIYSGIDEVKRQEFLKEISVNATAEVPCLAHSYFFKDKWVNG